MVNKSEASFIKGDEYVSNCRIIVTVDKLSLKVYVKGTDANDLGFLGGRAGRSSTSSKTFSDSDFLSGNGGGLVLDIILLSELSVT